MRRRQHNKSSQDFKSKLFVLKLAKFVSDVLGRLRVELIFRISFKTIIGDCLDHYSIKKQIFEVQSKL